MKHAKMGKPLFSRARRVSFADHAISDIACANFAMISIRLWLANFKKTQVKFFNSYESYRSHWWNRGRLQYIPG